MCANLMIEFEANSMGLEGRLGERFKMSTRQRVLKLARAWKHEDENESNKAIKELRQELDTMKDTEILRDQSFCVKQIQLSGLVRNYMAEVARAWNRRYPIEDDE